MSVRGPWGWMLQRGVSGSRWSDNIAALVIIPPAFVVMVVMDLINSRGKK